METENITDELIEKWLKIPKKMEGKLFKKEEFGHLRINYNLVDDEGGKYILYLRKNTRASMNDDFSCGLTYRLTSGEYFNTL